MAWLESIKVGSTGYRFPLYHGSAPYSSQLTAAQVGSTTKQFLSSSHFLTRENLVSGICHIQLPSGTYDLPGCEYLLNSSGTLYHLSRNYNQTLVPPQTKTFEFNNTSYQRTIIKTVTFINIKFDSWVAQQSYSGGMYYCDNLRFQMASRSSAMYPVGVIVYAYNETWNSYSALWEYNSSHSIYNYWVDARTLLDSSLVKITANICNITRPSGNNSYSTVNRIYLNVLLNTGFSPSSYTTLSTSPSTSTYSGIQILSNITMSGARYTNANAYDGRVVPTNTYINCTYYEPRDNYQYVTSRLIWNGSLS